MKKQQQYYNCQCIQDLVNLYDLNLAINQSHKNLQHIIYLIAYKPSNSRSIHKPTILSDLPISPSERTNFTQFYHSNSKVASKSSTIVTITPNQIILRPLIEKNLIRMEKTFACNKVFIVIVVKTCWSESIKRC